MVCASFFLGLNNCWAAITNKLFPTGFKSELKNILHLAWPVTFTNLFQFLILSESIMMCGHLSKLELDGVALANSIINAVGLSINTGAITACDTLFAQTFGGKNKFQVGVFLQQGLLIIPLFIFVTMAIHLNIEPIFLLFGQLPEVSRLAADYMTYFLPGLLFQGIYTILARYLQTQNLLLAPMLACFFGNVYNVVMQYIFIYKLNFRYQASAIFQATTYLIMVTFLIVYIIAFKKYKLTWNGWSRAALLNWGYFFSLAIPGIGMHTLEVFCFEIGTFLAGYLGETELGAQSILFQVYILLLLISIGFAVAINIRVGQSLGAGNPKNSITAYNVGLLCGLTVTCITCILCITLRNELPRVFTNVEDVIEMSSQIYPYLGIFLVLDCVGVCTAGCLRGCGQQKWGAFLVFLAFYIFGMPTAIALIFLTKLGVLGIWIGLMVGVGITVPAYIFIIWNQDWNRIVSLAAHRAGTSEESRKKETEWTPLLSDSEKLISKQPRTLSNASTSQANIKKYPTSNDSELYGKAFQTILRRRLISYGVVIAIFILGVLLRVSIPPKLYRHNQTDNSNFTIIN